MRVFIKLFAIENMRPDINHFLCLPLTQLLTKIRAAPLATYSTIESQRERSILLRCSFVI